MGRAFRSAGLFVGAMALSAGPLLAQEEEHSAAWDTLFAVDPGLMVWTVATFLALLFLLSRMAWKPLLGALDARETRIRDNIQEAQRLKDESEALLEEHRAQLAQARKEAQQIIADSRDAGERVRKDIEEKARAESQAILDRAKSEIERSKASALDEIRRESVDVALGAAAKLIGKNLDSDADRDLVADYLSKLGPASGAESGAEA